MPPPPVLVEGMERDLRRGPLSFLASPFRFAGPLVEVVLKRIFSGRLVLASIMEDLPYGENRVVLSGEGAASAAKGIVIRYRISGYDRARIEAFRKELAGALKPYPFMLIKQAESNERIAHACGTCRFGEDPAESVLDPHNRAHGISNLYVVDSSFFPSSGGTNPALTIAANALRVTDRLLNR